MSIPQPRTETYSKTNFPDYAEPGDEVEFPRFPTTGALKVTVTNNLDVPADFRLKTSRIKDEPAAHSDQPPVKTAGAGGETVVFDYPAPNTFYRVEVTFDTQPSSGSVDVEYEQTDIRRNVHVPEAYL